ncbi:MAG: cold-shock protein [Halieaceae bacterium]|nr:cold-shock protein [Halieaceae bacterium]
MRVIGKLVISLVVAALASTLSGWIEADSPFDLIRFATFWLATATTALLVSRPAKAPAKRGANVAPNIEREKGKVKWFNVTKGFGFITRSNGEEIFVHFRSIRGEGRRSLRDGQDVSYVVTSSDKGPQAEEVEAIN